jgi:selenocysteine-specific elongation factor
VQRTLPIGLSALRSALDAITATGKIIRLSELPESDKGAWLSREALAQISQAIVAAVTATLRVDSQSPGLAKETLRTQLSGPLRGVSARILDAVCGRLVSGRSLVAEREFLKLQTETPPSADPPALQAVLSALQQAQLAAPRLEDLPTLLAQHKPPLRPEEIKKIVEQLLRRGDLIRLKDLLFHRQAIRELSERLVAFFKERREISPSQFKDLVGQSRKYSIPLAEYFDAQRLTLRVGDQRRLRG